MSSKDRRLDYIFEQIEKKVPNAVILKNLESHMAEGAMGEKRGKTSVDRVMGVLKRNPELINIKKTVDNGYEDAVLKRDIVAKLQRETDNLLLGIQVKSSQRDVRQFIEGFGTTNSERWQNLASQKLIVLNGQLAEEKIDHDFNRQLSRIEKLQEPKKVSTLDSFRVADLNEI